MITRIFSSHHFRSVFTAALALVMIIASLGQVHPAYAQDDQPPAEGDGERGQKLDERLSRLYNRELEWLENQADRLAHTSEVAAKVAGLISRASEKGLDTSLLEEALAEYEARIGEVQSEHDAAGEILAAHAGFDDNGKVTDRSSAAHTVNQARIHLQEARHLINYAFSQLHHQVRAWLKSQRPQGEGALQP